MSALPVSIRKRHWMVALGGALALHAGVAFYIGQQKTSGAVAVGLNGVAVDLGTAGGSPGEAKAAEFAEEVSEATRVAEADTVAPEEVVETVEAPAEATEAVEPEPEVAAPVETAAAPVEVAEVPLYAPDAPDAPVIEEVAEVVPTAVETPMEPVEETTAEQAMPTPAPPPAKPRRAPPEPQVAETPEPVAEPKTVEAQAEEAEEIETAAAPENAVVADETAKARGPQVGKLTPDDAVGTGGKAGKGKTAQSGMESGNNSGGVPGQSADYTALLSAWLEKHKEYPRRAKLRRQEGTAYLNFVIDRDGRVLDFRLIKSSGYKLLDEEVTAMIERASPLPPVPGNPDSRRFVYTVPVNFNLR